MFWKDKIILVGLSVRLPFGIHIISIGVAYICCMTVHNLLFLKHFLAK